MLGTPVLGSTARLVACGARLHRVPSDVVMKNLAHEIGQECDDAVWFACVMLWNGQGELFGISPTSRQPPEEIMELMFRLSCRLNSEAHMNGHWITAWADDHLFFMWRDRRGNMVLSLGVDEPWERIRRWSDDEFLERCAQAYMVADQTNHEIDKKANDAVRQDSSYRSLTRH